jgi:hypothetical protein
VSKVKLDCPFSKLRPARKSHPPFVVAILSSLADRRYRVANRRSNVIRIVGRFHHLICSGLGSQQENLSLVRISSQVSKPREEE